MRVTSFLVVLLSIAFLFGCINVTNLEKATRTDTKVLDVNGKSELRVKNSRGLVKITGWEENKVEVKYTIVGRGASTAKAEKNLDKIKVNISKEGNIIAIDVDYPSSTGFIRISKGYVKLNIHAPRNSSLKIDTSSGNVFLKSMTSKISADTSSGDFVGNDLDGDLKVDTSSGDIRIVEFSGTADLETSSGDIRLKKYESSKIKTHSSSGDQRISEGTFTELTARASSGDIILHGNMQETGKLNIKTSSGDVVLRLQNDLNAHVYLSTSSGSMDISYEREIILKKRKRIECMIGSDSSKIEISTSSGDMSLRKKS